jgi:hypothetical protein
MIIGLGGGCAYEVDALDLAQSVKQLSIGGLLTLTLEWSLFPMLLVWPAQGVPFH